MKLKGKSLYSEYMLGDIVYYFIKQTYIKTTDLTNIEIIPIVERELHLLNKDFKFVKMDKILPIFTKK